MFLNGHDSTVFFVCVSLSIHCGSPNLDSPSGMLKKPAQVAPTMSTLHEDANVEEAEEEEIDVMEASKVPEDKCQLLPSSHRPSALLDRGHVKDHHQLHPSQTTTTAVTAPQPTLVVAATAEMVCIHYGSHVHFFPTGCICIRS